MKTYIYPPSNSINRDLIKSNGEINCNTEEKSCAEDILRLFKNFISGSATVAQQKLAKLIFLKPSRLLILLAIFIKDGQEKCWNGMVHSFASWRQFRMGLRVERQSPFNYAAIRNEKSS